MHFWKTIISILKQLFCKSKKENGSKVNTKIHIGTETKTINNSDKSVIADTVETITFGESEKRNGKKFK
jgi:hypothetical protein